MPVTAPWFDALGPVLSVHDSHGYSNFDRVLPTCRVLPTANVLHGQTPVGLLFSADWCAPCAAFTPILTAFYKARRERDPFQVVLVSRCKTKENTEEYFSTMPWTAMAHVDSMGQRGQELMTRFGVVTLPALVLVDGLGRVICGDGRQRLAEDPTGAQFPWKETRSLPPDPRLAPRRARPEGRAPSFNAPPQLPPDRQSPSTPAPRTTRRKQRPPRNPPDRNSTSTPAPLTSQPDRNGTSTPAPPTSQRKQHPPPKSATVPVVSQGKGAISFSLPLDVNSDDATSMQRKTAFRQSAKTSYRLTPAQLALMASAAPGALAADTLGRTATPSTGSAQATNSESLTAISSTTAADTSDSRATPSTGAAQGKPRSLMQPQQLADVHPFAQTLKQWRHGISVDCGRDWPWDVIEAAVERGPHPTACTSDAHTLFQEDIAYQVTAGFCKVMLWEDVKRMRPRNLKISPVALIPQVGRRGRIILDLSFPVYQDVHGVITATQESVNDTTSLTAPSTPVKEIGKVLPRLLQYMRDTPRGVHILFTKLDISDGFWRLVIRGEDACNFAYVLPQPPQEPIRLVIPAAVQMGWVESPGYFCTVTESARDLTQHFVDNAVPLPWDPVEDLMDIPDVPLRGRTDAPTSLLQVYVDDFCHATTQSVDGSHIPTIRRAAVYGIHSLFPPPSITNHIGGKEPISRKKLAQGDGNFASTKELIGFLFDGVKRTVRLPAAKAKAYITEAHRVLRRKTVPLKTLQALVGKLRHASIILPAAKGFFTPINAALRGNPRIIGLGQSSDVRSALEDLITLLRILSSRATHVDELVATLPRYVGYHDAAAEGAGGVWFSLTDHMPPLVWREIFPPDITSNVVTDVNPDGGITNSDLELAAEVLAIGVILEQAPNITHAPLGTLCDNTPTVSWVDKMASKAKTPVAGRLLRGLAVMLHFWQAGRLTTVHVPGTDNVMADIASRPAKAHRLFRSPTALSNTDFCVAFDTHYPLPENQLWSGATIPPWLRSNVFGTLRGSRLALRQWMGPNVSNAGKRGRHTVTVTTAHPAAHKRRKTSPIASLPLLSPCGKASTASEQLSRFSQSKGLCVTSPKDLFWTDIPTPEKHPRHNSTSTSPFHDY